MGWAGDSLHSPPLLPTHRFSTVCMFADVSGFTALSEAMARYGPEGAEHLARHLNSYFSQMVKIIASMGGDIFKFAGDAMLVLWPDEADMPIEERVQRAGQCALEIQTNLHKAALEAGVTLSVKIGIGVGEVSVLHLGGVLQRMEYVAVGEPLVQAFAAEHHTEAGGDVVMSGRAWAMASSSFRAIKTMDDGAVLICTDGKGECLRPSKKISINNRLRGKMAEAGEDVEKRLRNYVAGAILPWINPDATEQEMWGSDLRTVTVLFVNLGLKDMDMLAASKYDDAMGKMHKVLRAVQGAVYAYEGAVNKMSPAAAAVVVARVRAAARASVARMQCPATPSQSLALPLATLAPPPPAPSPLASALPQRRQGIHAHRRVRPAAAVARGRRDARRAVRPRHL